MTNKTNSAFSQQQRTQISNACEQVQDAININNSTIAQLNADLVRKADEIAIKWRAYGLPYNAIRDAVLEMAMWQKEQMIKSAFDGEITKFFDCNLSVKAQLPKDSKCCFGDKVKVIIVKEDEQ